MKILFMMDLITVKNDHDTYFAIFTTENTWKQGKFDYLQLAEMF